MDYKNGKIYQILNSVNDDIYIGSTTQPLSKRMGEHRTAMKRGSIYLVHQKMRELGVEHFYIELIEMYPCDSVEELLKREGRFIREIGTLNKQIAGRSKKEYYIDNKDHIIDCVKQYYEDNKDKIREYKKQHSEINKDTIREYKKEYYQANKDKIRERMKQYYENNKDHRKIASE